MTAHNSSTMNDEDKHQFKQAIKNLVETHQTLKTHNAQAKEMREKLKALKAVVLGFMEATSLDVCNVSHNGKNGEIAVRTSKSCLLYTSPSPRDGLLSRMPSSA